jgi:hypothetical protein
MKKRVRGMRMMSVPGHCGVVVVVVVNGGAVLQMQNKYPVVVVVVVGGVGLKATVYLSPGI